MRNGDSSSAPAAVFASEAEFQAQVVELAGLYGWWTYHNPDSRRSTPGWPDLVLVGHGRALFRELKTERGKVSPDQQAVIEMMHEAGLDVAIWRPTDWPAIEATLARR